MKTEKAKENFPKNHALNILGCFNGWENILFITSETKHDY